MNRDEFNQMLEANGIVFVGEAAWRVAQLVAAAEREACAELCDRVGYDHEVEQGAVLAFDLAVAIRARGE